MNAHHPAFGYSNIGNKGRILKDLINKGIIKDLGPEFPILVGKSTKPDIVLGNKHTYLNLAIEEGCITTSDHLPIIIKISIKSILKNYEPKRNIKRANWDQYKIDVENEINREIRRETLEGNDINKDKIDTSLKNWMKIIDDAAYKNIPTKRVQYYVHPQESDYIKLLKEQYKQLRAINSWTREQLDILKNIQERIKEEG